MRKPSIVLLAGALLAAAAVVVERDAVLGGLGRYLVADGKPAPADAIVVMRGDEDNYDRAVAGAALFKAGDAPVVYVSSALSDEGTERLRAHGIAVPSGQQRIVSVLFQSGVPCGDILVDKNPGGGGTWGEMTRIKQMLASRQAHSVEIVTSWFHSRRVKLIADRLLEPAGVRGKVAVANSLNGPDNWWHFRYVTLTVGEEYLKLATQIAFGAMHFGDDSTVGAKVEPAPAHCGP
jgi:uncharacterized SAM-binding protein YcdF (DUF218 family)